MSSKRVSGPGSSMRGVGLIEVLVAMFVMLFGLLALAGLLSRTQTAEFESYQRKQAVILLEDLVGRLAANRNAAACYAITTDKANGTPYLGTGGGATGTVATPACATGIGIPPIPSAGQAALAVSDLTAWSDVLKGGAEVLASNPTGVKYGAALDARGCVTSTTPTPAIYVEYQVSVAWRGTTTLESPTAASEIDINCAKGSYGDDKLRRVISTVVRVPVLN